MAGKGFAVNSEVDDEWSADATDAFNKLSLGPKCNLAFSGRSSFGGETAQSVGRGGFGSTRTSLGGLGSGRGGFGASQNDSADNRRGAFSSRSGGGFGASNDDSTGGGSFRGRGAFGSCGSGRGGFGSSDFNSTEGGGRGGFGSSRGGGGRGGFGASNDDGADGGGGGGFGSRGGGFGSRGGGRGGFGASNDDGGGGGFGSRGGGGGGFGSRGGGRGGFGASNDDGGEGGFGSRGGGFGSRGSGRGGFGASNDDDADAGGGGGFGSRSGGRGGFGSRGGGRGGFGASNDDDADGGGGGGFGSRGGGRGGFGSRGGGRGGFGASNDDDTEGGGFGSRGGFGGGRGGGRSFRNADGDDAGGGGGDGGSVCYKCNQSGHFARECPNADARACYRCKETGHISADCPNAPAGDAGAASAAHVPEESELEEIYTRTVHTGINFDKYERIDVEVSGENKPGHLANFESIGLPSVMMENVLRKYGYSKLTPVQKYGIPIILSGRDMMACAQTGSGKTAAFLLPLAKLISEMDTSGSTVSQYTTFPLALIVTPTRELCIQIYEFARGFLAGTNLQAKRVYGGPNTSYMRAELGNGCHILVATPGRLKDFVERDIVSLKKTRFLVLDEADQMLDRGFLDSVTWTLKQMPSERQTMMFSATFAAPIQALAQEYLRNYLYLKVGQVGAANPDVMQEVREVPQGEKQAALIATIEEWQSDPRRAQDRILVFVETKRQADFVGLMLSDKGFPCTTMHGDRLQREREIALRAFRGGKLPIMVATNVSARGVDISGIELVINMDLPQSFDMYVHRIGRTGRCGNLGQSISFYDHGRDSHLATELRKSLMESGKPVPDWLDVYADQCDGGGGGFGGGQRDMRRGVARDRFREAPDECEFAEMAFRPAQKAEQPAFAEAWD